MAKNKRKKNYKNMFLFTLLGIAIIAGSMGITSLVLNKDKNEEKPPITFTPPIPDPIDFRSEIDKMIDTMSLEEKVAQMFIARVPETDPQGVLQTYQFGGYIFFANNFQDKTKQQVIDEINGYQSVSKIPMFIGVDEEGGEVNRVSQYFLDAPFPSPQQLYAQGGMNAILENSTYKSEFLKSFGINVNFAPVADVSTNPNDYIYSRTFGQDASATADYVKQVVEQMKKDKMGSVVKHFPGYGNNINTHTTIAYDNRPLSQFEQSDFLPFISAAQGGVDCILVSHNIVQSMDATYPASISPAIHEIIRTTIQFDGVIITDDLIMQGVSEFGSSGDVAVLAALAGNDIILSSDPVTQYEAVLQAVKDDRISMEQIDTSLHRILEWKQSLGILNIEP